jgi:hypothetical protein
MALSQAAYESGDGSTPTADDDEDIVEGEFETA